MSRGPSAPWDIEEVGAGLKAGRAVGRGAHRRNAEIGVDGFSVAPH